VRGIFPFSYCPARGGSENKKYPSPSRFAGPSRSPKGRGLLGSHAASLVDLGFGHAAAADQEGEVAALVGLGRALRVHRAEAALEYFRALRAAPEKLTARERIAYIQITQDPERAVGIFEQIIEADPERSSAHTGLGFAHLERGDFAAARTEFERALELAPDQIDARIALAVACDWSGDGAAAELHYARVLELDPGNPDAHANLGMRYLQNEQFEEAASAFRKALHGRPEDPVLQNNLGFALGRSGDFAGAQTAFRKAGSEAAVQNNLGYTHYLSGNPERALQHYERALSLDPADPLPILRNLRDAELRIAERRITRGTAPSPSAPAP